MVLEPSNQNLLTTCLAKALHDGGECQQNFWVHRLVHLEQLGVADGCRVDGTPEALTYASVHEHQGKW